MRRWHFWNVAASAATFLEISFTDQVHSLLRHDSVSFLLCVRWKLFVTHSSVWTLVWNFFKVIFITQYFLPGEWIHFGAFHRNKTITFTHFSTPFFFTFWGFQHVFWRKIMWEFFVSLTNWTHFFEKNSKGFVLTLEKICGKNEFESKLMSTKDC